jgi:hypothetical protein
MSMSARKRRHRHESRRIETHRVRRAAKQALKGGHARLIRPDKWARRPEQPPPAALIC